MRGDYFLITCEHGGNQVPAAYRRLFVGYREQLDSHRGFDAGALVMAKALARALNAPLVKSRVTRLLIDLNRSITHPQLYSVATRGAAAEDREHIVARYYRPYRERVERLVSQSVNDGRRVIHLSSHSFTPSLDGKVRVADVGLLYHPGRLGESHLCARWQAALAQAAPTLRVRRNYPYAGKGDGLTAHLRKRFSSRAYVGIELEINQRIVLAAGRPWTTLRQVLIQALLVATGTQQTRQQMA